MRKRYSKPAVLLILLLVVWLLWTVFTPVSYGKGQVLKTLSPFPPVTSGLTQLITITTTQNTDSHVGGSAHSAIPVQTLDGSWMETPTAEILTPGEKIETLVSTETGPEVFSVEAASVETPELVKNEGSEIYHPPTLAPTATPGIVTRLIEEVTGSKQTEQTRFLTLKTSDWINLGISLLVILIGGFVLGGLLISILNKIARFTPSTRDEEYFRAIKPQFRLMVIMLSVRFATKRLLFLSADLKQAFEQLYFTIEIILLCIMGWKLVDAILFWYRDCVEKSGEPNSNNPLAQLFHRGASATIIFLGLVMILTNYGVNVNTLLAALGIGTLAISLAAQETLSNIISGIIILLDQPFRVGDRIEILEMGTWGDVVKIGLRSTRIRLLDNRMVIVPNTSISKNRIVNYTFPDPCYRDQSVIGVAYGTDLKQARDIITQTVRTIPGVLVDKFVVVLFWNLEIRP
jgi:MscS family membrane protein